MKSVIFVSIVACAGGMPFTCCGPSPDARVSPGQIEQSRSAAVEADRAREVAFRSWERALLQAVRRAVALGKRGLIEVQGYAVRETREMELDLYWSDPFRSQTRPETESANGSARVLPNRDVLIEKFLIQELLSGGDTRGSQP